jgi:tripartite-type tricarboxylate transporter receptor subunit TctC
MPGAGGNLVAGHIYNIAPKDGTVMALILPGTVTEPLFQGREKVKHDPAKLTYVGSANSEVDLCYVRADTGVTSLKDLAAKEVVIGASAEGGSTRDQATLQANLIGSRFRIVAGYPGSREILLAIEKGEVSGICGLGLPAFRQAHADWIESGFVRILSQDNARGDPKLTARGVPRTVDFARSAEDRQIMELVYAQQEFGRPFVMPPNVPAERVAALRKAFQDMLRDPAFIAETDKAQMEIAPSSGEEAQKVAASMLNMPASVIARAKQLIEGPAK